MDHPFKVDPLKGMLYIFLIFILGLVAGSFISAVTWRIPRGENFVSDRSRCVKCHNVIRWYDNIPLFSYLILKGKCRNCSKNISIRYPVLEFFTSIAFVAVYLLLIKCQVNVQGTSLYMSGSCVWWQTLGTGAFPYLLLVAVVMIAIFVTDWEYQIIPDLFVFILIISTIILNIISNNDIYKLVFSGLSVSLFLLMLNLITKGKGMGLGDVKLAFFAGIFFGPKMTISWIFMSFILGALIGVILLLLGKAQFGKRIAFGPFMVISFFIVLFWGEKISRFLTPYLN